MADATVTTVEHGDASRLPDAQWFWRRVLIYMVTIWAMAIGTWMVYAVYRIALANAPPSQLVVLGLMGVALRYSFYTVWAALILYGVGAAVTDVAQLAAAVRTTVKQTITTGPPVVVAAAIPPAAPPTPPKQLADPPSDVPPWKR
jgi:hypothetical protein